MLVVFLLILMVQWNSALRVPPAVTQVDGLPPAAVMHLRFCARIFRMLYPFKFGFEHMNLGNFLRSIPGK